VGRFACVVISQAIRAVNDENRTLLPLTFVRVFSDVSVPAVVARNGDVGRGLVVRHDRDYSRRKK